MRGGENATRRVRETGVGVAGECPGSFGAPSRLDGASREEFGGTCGERSGVECRGRTGCAARPLEKPERAWRRRSRASEPDLLVVPLFPRLLKSSPCAPGREACRRFHSEPQTRQSRLSGRRPLDELCGGGEREGTLCEQPGAGAARGFPWAPESTRLLAVQGPYLLQNFANCGAGRNFPAPTGESSRRAGSSPTCSAAPLGARRGGRLRGDPARRRLRGRYLEPAACPRTAGCGLSHPGLFSYSLA